MIALNLEWIYFGELKKPGNEHWFGAHLDLAGANAAAFSTWPCARVWTIWINIPRSTSGESE